MSAFSTAADEIIHQTLDVAPVAAVDDLDDYFDVASTASQIVAHDYQRIALQFPDELLPLSVPISKRLKRQTGRQLFILADTSYGSCCVDEVAAQHADADCIVHYGHACRTKTSRLPTIYVLGKSPVSPPHCAASLAQYATPSPASLVVAGAYQWQAHELLAALRPAFPRLALAAPSPGAPILHIGDPASSSRLLANLALTHPASPLYTYSPAARFASPITPSTRLLMRRYTAMLKARDADVFGILVGTLGVKDYLPLIARIRALLAQGGKKSYTVTVGKLNPSKLANFMEIECWVLVACPENSVIDSKEFLRPIITPFELEVALSKEPKWDGEYILDFTQLLDQNQPDPNSSLPTPPDSPSHPTQGDDHQTADSTSDDPDAPHFSLITGKYKHAKRYGASNGAPAPTPSTTLTLRNSETSLLADSAAAHYLTSSRTYMGLELRLGQDAPGVLEQGRSGIARGYQTDVTDVGGRGDGKG